MVPTKLPRFAVALIPLAAVLGVVPAAWSQVTEPNLIFEVVQDDRWRSMSEGPVMTFTPGCTVAGFTRKLDTAALAALEGKATSFVAEFSENGQSLAVHKFPRAVDVKNTYFKFNIVPDPASTEDKKLRWDWSGKLALALSKLPKGQHPIEVRGFFELDGNRTPVLLGTVTYDNTGGNGKMAQIAAGIDKNAGFDIVAHNKKFAGPAMGDIKVFLYNNSAFRTVVRYHNKFGYQTIALPGYGKKEVTIGEAESVNIQQADGGFKSGPMAGKAGGTIKIHR